MVADPLVLPYITIQHDFLSAVSDVRDGVAQAEDFWVSCYKKGEQAVHGKVKVELSQPFHATRDATFTTRDGVQFEIHAGSYTVACPALAISPTVLRVPRQSIGSNITGAITAFDVSLDSARAATAHADGNLVIHDLSGGAAASPKHTSVSLGSHTGATSLRFFPSSKVLLVTTTTYELRVTSATDLSTPRIMRGHRREVTDSAIVARGRNVVSCGKDGTLRLWDVGGGEQIRSIASQSFLPILMMSLGDIGDEWTQAPPNGEEIVPTAPHDKEVDTAGKAVFCALSDGTFEAFDLRAKTSIYQSKTRGTALHAIAYSSAHSLLSTGTADGIISVYDTRQLATVPGGRPLFSFLRNSAGVEDLAFEAPVSGPVCLIAATEDGLPFRTALRPDGPAVVEELVGMNVDAVRAVRCVGGSVWTSGDDGLVRRY